MKSMSAKVARETVSRNASDSLRAALPYDRGMVGSWIGDTWIPPSPWKLYSATDLAQMWSTKKIWWIGDSLARRGAMTLYHILNTSHSAILKEDLDEFSMLNVNKLPETERERCPIFQKAKPSGPIVCRSMPGSPPSDVKSFVVSYLCKASEVAMFLRSEMNQGNDARTNIAEFDVIVIALGAHEKGNSNQAELYTALARL